MNEVIFEVREDEADGGYTASALGVGIHTEAETIEELRSNDDPAAAPQAIWMRFVQGN